MPEMVFMFLKKALNHRQVIQVCYTKEGQTVILGNCPDLIPRGLSTLFGYSAILGPEPIFGGVDF